MGSFLLNKMKMRSTLFFLFTAAFAYNVDRDVTTPDWSPDPCFPDCTTPVDFTSPDPELCVKTDCFDLQLCQEWCIIGMQCRAYEWVPNNDDNDIFGETWCGVDGLGMCYCCKC